MFCAKCGKELPENAQFCASCGTPVAPISGQAQPGTRQPVSSVNLNSVPFTQENAPHIYATPQGPYPRENNSGLLLAAFIINLITTIAFAILIIPLAWCIPMTVHSYGIYKGTQPNTVAFGVCTLLFVDIISGILMLVADKDA